MLLNDFPIDIFLVFPPGSPGSVVYQMLNNIIYIYIHTDVGSIAADGLILHYSCVVLQKGRPCERFHKQ